MHATLRFQTSRDMWKFEHSLECQVSRDFAWGFWTDVSNWVLVDPAIESVKLDGAFATGTKGTTKPRDLPPTEWELTEVEDRRRAVIEVVAPGAILKFIWMFEDIASGGTRITQQVTLDGERAEEYVGGVKELEQGTPAGMQRLADALVNSSKSAE
jgi:hypothetical protein